MRVRIVAPGMPDPDVLAWAACEHRILLTFDKNFGELARGSGLPRMPMPKPEEAGLRLAALITAREDWTGNFSVIDPAAFGCDRSGSRTAKPAPFEKEP